MMHKRTSTLPSAVLIITVTMGALLSLLMLLYSGAAWGAPTAAIYVVASCDNAGFDAALVLAHADIDPAPAIVDFGVCTGVIAIKSEKSITADIVVEGHNKVALDAGQNSRHFNVATGGELVLRNLSLINGNSSLFGGSIYAQSGVLATNNVQFHNNHSDSNGGAVLLASAEGHFLNSHFEGNETVGISGGAIAIQGVGASAWITGSVFLSNTNSAATALWGGAISLDTGTRADVIDSHFEGNSTLAAWGGAIGVNKGILTVRGSTFTRNSAGDAGNGLGGAIGVANISELVIEDSEFTFNHANSSGGGVFGQNSNVRVRDSVFRANEASGNFQEQGGGLTVLSPTDPVIIDGVSFIENVAQNSGGGAYISFAQDEHEYVDIRNSTFARNQAVNEGQALFIFTIPLGDAPNQSTSSLINVTFDNNVPATDDQAAIYQHATPLTIDHATFTLNAHAIEVSTMGTSVLVRNSILDSRENNCIGISDAVTAQHSARVDPSCDGGGSNNIDVDFAPLGSLQNNGGLTDTRLPLPGSVVIDSADSSVCPSTDQRGEPRPQFAGCDMGAVEFSVSNAATATVQAAPSATAAARATATAQTVATAQAQQTATAQAQQTATAQAQQTATAQAQQTATAIAGATQTAEATANAGATMTAVASTLEPDPKETPGTPVPPLDPDDVKAKIYISTGYGQ